MTSKTVRLKKTGRTTRKATRKSWRRPGSVASVVSLALVALLVGVACSGGDEPAAPKPPPTAPAPPSPPPAPAPPPTANPTPAPPSVDLSSGDAAAGKSVYAQNCATCHGAGGAGDGVLAAALDPKPAKHTDGNYMNAIDDAHLYKVIKEGGPAVGKSPLMAPWGGTLSDQQIVHVIAFIRTLAVPPYPGS